MAEEIDVITQSIYLNLPHLLGYDSIAHWPKPLVSVT